MWFADVGLVLAAALLAGWTLVVGCSVALRRIGRAAWMPLRPELRWPVAVGSLVAALLFAGQAAVVDHVEDHQGTGQLDESVWAWFVGHRPAGTTALMTIVSAVGGAAPMTVLAVLAVVLLWWYRHRAEAAVVLVATAVAELLSDGFKSLYGRARPPVAEQLTVETNFSLPSGHAVASMVVLGLLAALALRYTRRVAVRVAVIVAVAVGIATVGVSRLYLGVHWLSDILTSWLLGGAWLAVCVTALMLVGAPPRHDALEQRDAVSPR